MNTPTLHTPRLTLRPPRREDAPATFAAYAQDADVTRFLVWQPHRTLADTEAFMERLLAATASGKQHSWILERPDDGAVLGSFALRLDGHKADVGYLLARAAWGQGLMTEALRAVIGFAWTLPQVQRVWAVCDVDNPASGRVMEKAGMQYEGRLRAWSFHPNVSAAPRDCLCYAVVRGGAVDEAAG